MDNSRTMLGGSLYFRRTERNPNYPPFGPCRSTNASSLSRLAVYTEMTSPLLTFRTRIICCSLRDTSHLVKWHAENKVGSLELSVSLRQKLMMSRYFASRLCAVSRT